MFIIILAALVLSVSLFTYAIYKMQRDVFDTLDIILNKLNKPETKSKVDNFATRLHIYSIYYNKLITERHIKYDPDSVKAIAAMIESRCKAQSERGLYSAFCTKEDLKYFLHTNFEDCKMNAYVNIMLHISEVEGLRFNNSGDVYIFEW